MVSKVKDYIFQGECQGEWVQPKHPLWEEDVYFLGNHIQPQGGFPYKKFGIVLNLLRGVKSQMLVSLRVKRTNFSCQSIFYSALKKQTMKNKHTVIFSLSSIL